MSRATPSPGESAGAAAFVAGVSAMAGHDTERQKQVLRDALAQAEQHFRAAVAAAPDLAQAWVNLALLREQAGDDTEAETCYQRALALPLAPLESATTRLNYGGLLARQKRLDEAEMVYAQGLRELPEQPGLWSNLGALYAARRLDDEAEACYERALAFDPAYAKALFNRGVLHLRQGRWGDGWMGLEARDWYAALAERLPCRRWSGEPLAGCSILIGYEAGHGDMIQFCRYAAQLKAAGALRVDLLCHPALKRLMHSLTAVDDVWGFDESLPVDCGYDYWVPPLSLPYLFAIRPDTPTVLPYLQAEPALVAHWAGSLPAGGLRVGLVWKGNPRFENDADRSLPSLLCLAPLGEVSGVHFISLQKAAGEDEAAKPPAGLPVVNLGPQMRDFADAAALVAQLDLVISVDTAMAHLAGALGKPCWLLLPHYQTDWRWLDQRTDSPWYPGVMRLFRQTREGDWAPVVDELLLALQALTQRYNAH
ncbi:tetratricopeptide repeat protein [Variovorax sp. HJSM1_2]|uniref:tetratricopeptide repeat protein n=1 Tax=Variovorax sp. HJSM1_2 TaxID=3366263 RepID=UPI003BD74794